MDNIVKKILILDDEEYVLQMLALHIESQGYQVFPTATKSEATSILKQEKVELIITDLMVGNYNGLDFVKEVRKLKEYQNTPILVLSGHCPEEVQNEVLAAGADKFIPKPVLPGKLILEIQKIIKK